LFDLIGSVFILMSLYLLFGRFVVLAREARATVYAVTDRRVLLIGGAFRRKIVELRMGSLPTVTVNQDLKGIGSVAFGDPIRGSYKRWGATARSSRIDDVPTFIAIERPSDVARIIDQARETRSEQKAQPV
jgi:hypothetical protein